MKFEINIDWMELWSEQADEYVARGIELRKVIVEATDWEEAKKKAIESLPKKEKEEYLRHTAGVL